MLQLIKNSSVLLQHSGNSIQFGAELHIHSVNHTDHKNILIIGDSSQQRLCWISYVDEYGPELHYVEWPRYVVADNFSRLSHNDVNSPLAGKKTFNVVSNSESDNDNELLYSSK